MAKLSLNKSTLSEQIKQLKTYRNFLPSLENDASPVGSSLLTSIYLPCSILPSSQKTPRPTLLNVINSLPDGATGT